MCYYITVADLGNCNAVVAERQDALASGASGGNPVEVQILSTAPFLSITVIFNHNAVVAERQTHHLEGVAGRPVWVQIPPTAPNEKDKRFTIFVKRFLFVRAAEFFCFIYCL